MTDWKPTQTMTLKDVPQTASIIAHLEQMKALLQQQIQKDLAAITAAEALKEKAKTGRVE
jgi:hypothetical protein